MGVSQGRVFGWGAVRGELTIVFIVLTMFTRVPAAQRGEQGGVDTASAALDLTLTDLDGRDGFHSVSLASALFP